MNVSKLTDVELNRAMVELEFGNEDKDIERLYRAGKLDHLTDWNLTMPLAVENELKIDFHTKEVSVIGHYPYSKNKNPLRAICEVLVLIALEKKNG